MEVRSVTPRDATPSGDEPAFGPDYFGDPNDEVIVVDGTGGARPGLSPPHSPPSRDRQRRGRRPARRGDVASAVRQRGGVRRAGRRPGPRVRVSGKLADDDLVMYDRETGPEWKPSQGRAIAGELAGCELDVIPASILPARRFVEAYPDGVVLQPPGGKSEAASDDDDTPARIRYDRQPYDAYFEAEGYGLGAHRRTGGRDDWDRDDLDPKAIVVGLAFDGDALGSRSRRSRRPAAWCRWPWAGGRSRWSPPPTEPTRSSMAVSRSNPRTSRVRSAPTGPPGTAPPARATPAARSSAPARRLFAFTWRDDHGPDAFYEA